MIYRFSTIVLLLLLAINLPVCGLAQMTSGQTMDPGLETGQGKATGAEFNCLPEAYDLNEIIAYQTRPNGKEVAIMLKDRLAEMKASCISGKLVDKQKREIKLFRPACFGNPPADYDEIRQTEQQELSRLQKHYTVIIIECNPRIQ